MDSDSVEHLLAPKLHLYREWRARWPLWTGEREAWAGEAWVDRIHWSAYLLLTEIGLGLKAALPEAYTLTNPLTPDGHFVALRAGTFDQLPPRHRLPDLYLLRVLATSAQFADTIPNEPNEVEIPCLGPEATPEEELEDLSRKLARILVKDTGTGTLASKLARHHQRRGGGKQAATESEAELAVEMARALGVTVERRGTTRQTISPATLKDLRREIREVASEVGTWRIEDRDVIALGHLVTKDSQLSVKAGSDPRNWLRLLESADEAKRERAMKQARKSWLARDARRLVFPFLRQSEIDACVRGDDTKKTADELLLNRLPADITRSTLASIISRH